MAPAPDDELDDLSPDEERKFSRYLDRALEDRAKQRKRREPPADFGEFMDRLDDVLDSKLEEFGLERVTPRASDDAPTRGGNDRRPPKQGGKGDRSWGEKFLGIGDSKAS